MELPEWNSIKDKVLRKIEKEWLTLLDDKNLHEKDYHRFLKNHPAFLLTPLFGLECYVVINKLKLGSERETDFVIVKEGYSDGTKYNLIEIKSPHAKLFNKDGTYSKDLNKALAQVGAWQRWLIDNRTQMKKLFPSGSTRVQRNSNLTYTILIGRRSYNEEEKEQRVSAAKNHKVNIVSYDRITDFLKTPYHLNSNWIFSTEMESYFPDGDKRKLINPLYVCTSDSEWKKISPSLSHTHIYGRSLEHLLKYRKYNKELIKEFDREAAN
ncbi:MAG: Shedu anti-phage system protein SduA domain-containing protein [Cyclobacteriaceae bacterium]